MFVRSKKNDEFEASEALLSRLPLGLGHLCSDRPNTTLPVPVGRENMEPDRGEISCQGCSEIVPALRMPSPPDDVGDSASMFTTIHHTRVSTRTFASIPSSSVDNVGG
jgi:hypothetical protein